MGARMTIKIARKTEAPQGGDRDLMGVRTSENMVLSMACMKIEKYPEIVMTKKQ